MLIDFGDEGIDLLPTKIVAVARNYHDHAREMGKEVPSKPRFFLKPTSSLLEEGKTVILPRGVGRVDHEVELAAIIGMRCSRVSPEDVLDYVMGYTIAVDVTARDLQAEAKRTGMPWSVSKGYDTFCPLGPRIAPAGAISPQNLAIRLSVNGEVRQKGNTEGMVFSVAELVSSISQVMTLEPHDVILTGTPVGVGPIVDGDEVEASIRGIGTLRFLVESE